MRTNFFPIAFVMAFILCSPSFADLQSELEKQAPQITPYVIARPVPLAWESSDLPEAKLWSKYAYSVINQYFDELDKAQDVQAFCPKYPELNRDEKIMAWADIMVGISYRESGYDPLNRTLEEGGGIDDITEQPVYSEGLLQLSYQDIDSNPYCLFDWEKDKTLALNDPHRTILNPYNNLYCGIRTMADLVRDNKTIIVSQGGYWSTIQAGVVHGQLKNVEKLVKKLPFCEHHFVATPVEDSLQVIKEIGKALGD